MPEILLTDRLFLQPLALADADQVQPLFARWEIVQHLNAKVPWPFPADGVLSYYRDVALPAVERGEEWHWTLRLREAPQTIVGSIGLMHGNRKGDIHRGFWLATEWQGRGLMTEAVIVVNDYWFETLGFPVLRVTKAVANITSRRISEKTGMRLVATCESDYVSGRLPSETWEISAEEWRVWRSQHPTAPRES